MVEFKLDKRKTDFDFQKQTVDSLATIVMCFEV